MTETVLRELTGTLEHDLLAFLPELVVCAAIVFLLLARLFRLFDKAHLGWIALLLTVGCLAISCVQWKIFGTPG